MEEWSIRVLDHTHHGILAQDFMLILYDGIDIFIVITLKVIKYLQAYIIWVIFNLEILIFIFWRSFSLILILVRRLLIRYWLIILLLITRISCELKRHLEHATTIIIVIVVIVISSSWFSKESNFFNLLLRCSVGSRIVIFASLFARCLLLCFF